MAGLTPRRTSSSIASARHFRKRFRAWVTDCRESVRVVLRGVPAFHAAGASPCGWTICAVRDTQESWERFRDGTLGPALQEGIEGGFDGPPQETAYELHTLLP